MAGSHQVIAAYNIRAITIHGKRARVWEKKDPQSLWQGTEFGRNKSVSSQDRPVRGRPNDSRGETIARRMLKEAVKSVRSTVNTKATPAPSEDPELHGRTVNQRTLTFGRLSA